jgi:hypothetical protein
MSDGGCITWGCGKEYKHTGACEHDAPPAPYDRTDHRLSLIQDSADNIKDTLVLVAKDLDGVVLPHILAAIRGSIIVAGSIKDTAGRLRKDNQNENQ